MRINRDFLILTSIVLSAVGCSVEAGKIPVASMARPPEVMEKTRDELKSTLTELQASVAMVGRVQRVIQRGLSERDVDASGDPVPANLFAPSNADTLTFDREHPERFEYRINNSASFALRTRSGGKIEVILAGTLDDTGEKIVIKDAKLEVIHARPDDRQVFHILYEKQTTDDGMATTEWSIDFRQLSDLYRNMGGEDAAIAALEGFLEVRISETETHVVAEDFALSRNEISVIFEKVEIHIIRGSAPSNDIQIKGHVDQNGIRKGEFSVSRAADSEKLEFALKLDVDTQ